MRCFNCCIDQVLTKEKFVERNGKIICAGCSRYYNRFYPTQKDFKKEIEKTFKKFLSPSADYDAILLLSGGKDSTASLYLAKKAYNLRILAITIQNGFVSHEAQENISQVTSFLQIDHMYLHDNEWRKDLIVCIKKKKMPCGPLCLKHKELDIQRIRKLFPNVRIFITGDELPFIFPDRYSAVKLINDYCFVRILRGWVKREKEVFSIIKDVPWKKPTFYGYTTDCLAVGYALEQYHKFHKINFEELFLSDRVRHKVINKKEFFSSIKNRTKVHSKHKIIVENIINQANLKN